MTDQEKTELAFTLAAAQGALNKAREHNEKARRQRDMLDPLVVVGLSEACSRIEALLGKPCEPAKKKSYSSMKR